ncbi:arylphorin subunit alpha [Aphomia sociella]
MREVTLAIIYFFVVGISGFLIKVPITPDQPTYVLPGWIHIQKLMLPLFDNVCEESTDPVIIHAAEEFTLDEPEDYTDYAVITNFQNLQSGKGFLPKNEIFSEYNIEHRNELKIIYSIMLHAKNFDIFFKTAAWARQNINCGLFIDALYLAILTRPDLSKLSIPAPYELLPNYFIRKDIIMKASSLLAGEDFTLIGDVKDEGNAYILDANYTANINDDDDESKLAYFREDIGLNSFYFFRKLKNFIWLTNNISYVDNRCGEHMYQSMKQFSARYDLERYSNGLPGLESLNWSSIVNYYDPMLIYSTGIDFAHKSLSSDISSMDGDIEFLQNIENNIENVVTHLEQNGYNKTQIINHLMEIFVTEEKNYETLGRQYISDVLTNDNRQYSVLDHLMTSLRDPVFWKLNKKIVELIDKSLKVLPTYTRNEIYFPGVEILNIETKKMITLFENFQFDVSDSLKSANSNNTFQVKINQQRLIHKPFVIKLNISSFVAQKGLAKIYLGPKMLPGEFALNKNRFVLLDFLEINLKKGINLITRSSDEMTGFSGDFISLPSLRKRVEDAEYGLDALPLESVASQIGYPNRLILPKGLTDGLPLQLFVFIAPLTKVKSSELFSNINTEFNTAILSPGYPFDLSVEDHQLFNLPNAMAKEIVISHKGNNKNYGGGDFNKKWNDEYSSKFDYTRDRKYDEEKEYEHYNNEFDNTGLDTHSMLSLRPEFTKRKEPQDYSSKRGQYGKKPDYSFRKDNFNSNKATSQGNNNDEYVRQPIFKYKKPFDYSSEKRTYENKDLISNKYDDEFNENEEKKPFPEMTTTTKVEFKKDIVEKDNANLIDVKDSNSSETNKPDLLLNKIKFNDDLNNKDSLNIKEETQQEYVWNILNYILHAFDFKNPEEVYEMD